MFTMILRMIVSCSAHKAGICKVFERWKIKCLIDFLSFLLSDDDVQTTQNQILLLQKVSLVVVRYADLKITQSCPKMTHKPRKYECMNIYHS